MSETTDHSCPHIHQLGALRDRTRALKAEVEILADAAEQTARINDVLHTMLRRRKAIDAPLDALISAVHEITCTLSDPDGWTLGFQEAVELDKAVRALIAAR